MFIDLFSFWGTVFVPRPKDVTAIERRKKSKDATFKLFI